MKKSVIYLLLLFACSFLTEKTFGQSGGKPILVSDGQPPIGAILIYIGAGSNSPSTKLKDDAYATNTVGFDANVFISIIKKKNFSF